MNHVSLVMPYYSNQTMLAKQFEIFNSYPEHLKPFLEVVLVDDASPMGERAEEVIKQQGLSLPNIQLRLYRVLTDLRWNQHGARNIGAKEAKMQWLLLTDIDHIITPELMTALIEGQWEEKAFYMFDRIHWHDKSPKPAHPNTFFMTKKYFWKAGGYDETFCGHYGTDGHFYRQCQEVGRQRHISIPLELVGRDSIPDASTRTLQRKEGRDPDATQDIKDFKKRNGIKVQVLRLPWKKVL